jgi:hypothetical protein
LPALVLLRKPLFGLAKRRKQPERYAQYFLNFPQILSKYYQKSLKIGIDIIKKMK